MKIGHLSGALAITVGSLALPMAGHAQTSASAYTTGHRYDLAGRETGTIRPSSNGAAGPFLAVRNTYDAAGRLIKAEEGTLTSWQSESVLPKDWTGFTLSKAIIVSFDDLDRKLVEAVVANDLTTVKQVTQFSYDGAGQLLCTAMRMNSANYPSVVGDGTLTGGQLPSSACSLNTEGNAGPDRIAKNIYDIYGQLIQVRKGVGTSLEQAYTTYAYSANGKQTDVIDANGNRATYTYDGFDRLVQWNFPSTTKPTSFNGATQATALSSAGSANSDDYEAYAYDANGNRTSFRKRDGSVLSYTYDALNRVTVKVVPSRSGLGSTHTRSVYYSYDLQGHQLTAQFDNSGGEGVINTFDGFGRQLTSALTMDGATRTVSYQYDANGNRTRITYPDNNYVTYNYDGLDRPSSILRSGSATVASYGYNADGTRASFNGGVNTSYGYDAIGRLSSLANTPAINTSYTNTYGFSYNPASQITSLSKSNNSFTFNGLYNVNRNYTTNGLNQYTAAGGASFTYDANGNLTADGTTTFLYDIENRLVNAGGAKNAQLRYDPLGRLYEMAGPTGTTRFLYDGDALIGEYDGSGNLLRRYIHSADMESDDPIAWYEGGGFDGASERMLRPDWQGSIALVTDNAGSNIFAVNTYDEYGIPGSSNTGRFQYTGQAWMAELGMYYYKARFYSPTLGRFLQTDPIGYKDQVNLYAYVGNDPMDGIDFSGQTCESIICLPPLVLPPIPNVTLPTPEEAAEIVVSGARKFSVAGILWMAVTPTSTGGCTARGCADEARSHGAASASPPPEDPDDKFKKRKTNKSGKEAAKGAPSWVKGKAPRTNESGKEFAKRLLDEKYGENGWTEKGPGSEFNQIKKYADRGFE